MEGGAEGIVHLHKLVEDEYLAKGELERPLAVVQTDEANCFGTLEFRAIRRAIVELVPSLGPWELWRQSQDSVVEQPDVEPYKKNRGAEQGDVMGPVEAGVTLVDLATEIRRQVHLMQSRGELDIPSSDKQPDEARKAMVAEVSKLQALALKWDRVVSQGPS